MSLSVNEQIAIQQILRIHLERVQNQNPRYSLRSFAKKLGIHPSMLSYLLSGKRAPSRKLAERIVRSLKLDPQTRSEILALFPKRRELGGNHSGANLFSERYAVLESPKFSMIAEWEYFAFLSLMRCADFQDDATWVSKRLGISRDRAEEVREHLLKMQLIELDSEQVLRRVPRIRTADDLSESAHQLAMRKFYGQTLELAQRSLERDPMETRDFSSITFAIDPLKMSVAKEKIRLFEDEMAELIGTGNLTEVYRLSVALFPMTKV